MQPGTRHLPEKCYKALSEAAKHEENHTNVHGQHPRVDGSTPKAVTRRTTDPDGIKSLWKPPNVARYKAEMRVTKLTLLIDMC